MISILQNLKARFATSQKRTLTNGGSGELVFHIVGNAFADGRQICPRCGAALPVVVLINSNTSARTAFMVSGEYGTWGMERDALYSGERRCSLDDAIADVMRMEAAR